MSDFRNNPADNYMLKANNRNNRTTLEIYSKLTIMTPEWRQWTYFTTCSSISTVNVEVNADWQYFKVQAIVEFQINGAFVENVLSNKNIKIELQRSSVKILLKGFH